MMERTLPAVEAPWRFDGPPQLADYCWALYFAVAFPVARFFLDVGLYEKVATWLVNSNTSHGTNKLSKDLNRARITKSLESMWKLTYYLAMEVFIFHISYGEPWFGNTDAFFHGWPNQTLKFSLKLYYNCQCGFYMYSIVALLVWETRRKDFSVMMSHHIVTLVLIGYSYISGDLIMELAKLCKYSGKELSASICFGVFALSWLLLRLVYFPFWIIRSSSYEFPKHADQSNLRHVWVYYVFNTMLITLLVFHIYWWTMICSMVYKQLQNKGKVGDDVRSDSEDDD